MNSWPPGMGRREFLRTALLLSAAPVVRGATRQLQQRPPNVVLITTDDLNADSVGVFGCRVPETTPNLDRLASEGIRFEYAHVQVANCMPSRNVMQTGRYPHSSGVEGFYQVQPDYPILPDLLKEHGYFTAISGKVSHSTPCHPYEWDLVLQPKERTAARSPLTFAEQTAAAVEQSRTAGKPLYLLLNITDPHVPFYGLDKRGTEENDPNVPSRVYRPEEVVVPGFLPDLPAVRFELAHYFSSVRRADDCVGAILQALQEAGEHERTVVMFLSDHGMPFPFAKTNVYHHSTRTPWIVRWPQVTRPGSVDRRHMISAIDFMPTVLDIAGVRQPPGLQGRSFLPLLRGKPQEGRDLVVKEYNENSAAGRHPMRCVQSKTHCYIFNPWADGKREFKTATTGTLAYRAMREAAATDPNIAARLDLFVHRVREELYHVETDPDCLRNLADAPEAKSVLNNMRHALEQWMEETADPLLTVFRNRDNEEQVQTYMKDVQDQATARRQKGERGRARPQRNDLVAFDLPASLERGAAATIVVRHRIPPELGEQLVHVTLKDKANKRQIHREVLKASGTGALPVRFEIPPNLADDAVRFAVFVGTDFPSSLQHLVTDPVPLK